MLRILAALLALLLIPAAAQAGPAFTIGEGESPHLIVDAADGTAHVVWGDGVADKFHTCEIPRGATACTDEEVLDPVPGAEPDDAFLLRRTATQLDIIVPHYVNDEVWRYTSGNNGDTWSGPAVIYDQTNLPDANEPILNAGASEYVIPNQRFFYSAAVNGGDIAETQEPSLADGGNANLDYDYMVARAGANYIATAQDGTNSYYWTSTNPNTASGNWSAPTLIGEGDDSRLAGDGTNAYLLTHGGGVSAARAEIRKWTGASFGAPVVIANEQPYINDITVSPTGGVGAIWRKNEPSSNRLRFALSTDGGASYALRTIGFEDIVFSSMDVALANDNSGFAIYEGKSTPATAAKRFIEVRSTDPVPEPTPPPTTGGTTTTPPTVTPPKPTTPTSNPTVVGRRVVTTSNGATITLGLPRGCIPAGRPFIAVLTWKKQRRKGNKFVKIFRTDFFIGNKVVKVDKKVPFRQLLRIPNPKRGQSYSFRARAYIKVKRGRSPKKSIRSTLRVCT